MTKIKLLIAGIFIAISSLSFSQTLTITNPSLTTPYQVAAGTAVTFEWDGWSSAPTSIFTHSQAPTVNQYLPPDPSWTTHSNFTANPNGTYSITLTINADTWVFGGLNAMLGWQYSNVIEIQAISSYVITASDSLICSTGDTVLFTAPAGTAYTYQWFKDQQSISGATAQTYAATSAGTYHCEITISGTVNVTNNIQISNYTASFSGSLGTGQINFMADQTFSSYQWYERTPGGNLTAIAGATTNQYQANITTSLKYYTFEGTTSGGCVVQAPERPVVDSLFATPVVTLYTIPNSLGYVCPGTPVSIASNGNAGPHQWYHNNQPSYTSDSINIYSTNQNGSWYVEVACLHWPEVIVTSNTVTVNILQMVTPSITGANFYSKFCPGDVINMILTDEGYTYSWYVHDTVNVYNASHLVNVPTGSYQHTFAQTTYVTVVGEFFGCSVSKTIKLSSYADQSISVSIDNYDQQYLCTDSTVNLYVPAYAVSNFHSYQWHENMNGVWTVMAGDTNSILEVDHPGEYKVTATPVACSSVVASSYSKKVKSYLDRKPSIYGPYDGLCLGDTVELNLSAGNSWFAKQWLESEINMGSQGYQQDFVGMVNNSGGNTQEVTKYGAYIISAKHNSCPNGLKTKSNIVTIKPKLNPTIVPTTPLMTQPKKFINWDSTNHYIACLHEPVSFTLDNLNFSSIRWHQEIYAGPDDYQVGTQFSTQDTADVLAEVYWITAVVTDTLGCVGQSTPVLLDAWAFQSPAVASYNNNELCNPGDSTLIHVAFAGTWVSYEWFVDGVAIPNSNNDSLYAKQAGMHTVTCYPALCPTMPFSSGLGPTITYLEANIMENDSIIWATPYMGYYTYQWFLDGDSINPPDTNYPMVLIKEFMANGTYTVAVSNSNCTKMSTSFIWTQSGMAEIAPMTLKVYPNPANNILTIETADLKEIQTISMIDIQGRTVYERQGLSSPILDISHLPTGVYMLRVESKEGLLQFLKITKQ